jgi:hypothetical protein
MDGGLSSQRIIEVWTEVLESQTLDSVNGKASNGSFSTILLSSFMYATTPLVQVNTESHTLASRVRVP